MRLLILLLPACALALLTLKGSQDRKAEDPIKEQLIQTYANETEAQERDRLLAEITPVHIDPSTEDDFFEGNYSHPAGEDQHIRKKRQAWQFATKWPGNTVYYFYAANLPQETRNAVDVAVKELRARSCVKFVYSATAPNRIRIHQGKGCESSIGMDGGQQDMSLGVGCGRVVGNVQHEFFHALGIIHTQCREDRNKYINVDTQGVQNFVDQAEIMPTKYFVPYEYGSFMHYPADLHSGTKTVFVAKDKRHQYTMGGKMITFYDVMTLNKFYGCNGCAVCKNGGVPRVRDCRVCECPAGYGGALCDQRPAGCGTTLTATEIWKTEKITAGDPKQNNVRDNFQKCNTWITAPQGKQIELKITEIINPKCNFGCKLNGMEIKGDEDAVVTNPRHCCNESVGTLITSEQNPTPIISYARAWYSTFTIQYRYVKACRDNRDWGCTKSYCESDTETFSDKKYYCGKTCGLCEQPVPVCVDGDICDDLLDGYNRDCARLLASEDINGNDQLLEFHCAKTCKYCSGNATTPTTTTSTTTTTTTLKPTTTATPATTTTEATTTKPGAVTTPTTTAATTATTLKPTATKVLHPAATNKATKPDCKETQTACDIAYGDVLPNMEKGYFCGKYCRECLQTIDCMDSKFCPALLKESGDCDQLLLDLNSDINLLDFYCGKTCAGPFCKN